MLVAAVGQAAGNLVQPAANTGKGLYGCLKSNYDYAKNLQENYKELLNEKEVLISRKEDVKKRIFNKQATMEPTNECALWLRRVEAKEEEVVRLETRYKKERHGSCGFFRLFPRAKLSKGMLKMTESVVALKHEMDLANCLAQRDVRDIFAVRRNLPTELSDVPSIAQHVEKLLNFVKDDKVKRIGIHGSYGVGKTTIMKSLHRRVEKDNMFDTVIWVTVSKKARVDQIQKAVLESLNIRDEDGGSEDRIGNLIFQVLDKKKYLLLLDEVNSDIDLDRIGISHDHGKVVLASRTKYICDIIELDDTYEVNRLPKEDAWKLFHDIVGIEVNKPLLQNIAKQILRQCGGHPQVIKAVGKHLKGNCREDFLSRTLTSLRTYKASPLEPMQEVFEAFKLVYDGLDDRLKFSLLYSASFPDDHEIYRDHLIECWRAEQLILEDETFTIARDSGKVMLQKLLDRHLFQQGKSPKFVNLPILFRNAALRMATKHSVLELLVTHEEMVGIDYFSADKWRNARVISLIQKDVSLPCSPECLKISTLFLQNSRSLTTLHDLFFDHMSELRVLDLCGTGIESLPPSVSKLSNLKALYVNNCHRLTWLPEEIKLAKDLEVLDVSGTGMLGLPVEVGELTHLRCLRASFRVLMGNGNNCIDSLPVEMIPPNTLSKLSLLEELSIGVDPIDSRWNDVSIKIAAEVATLNMLTTISFYFPSVECLETFWSNRKTKNALAKKGFRSFKLFVGSYQRRQASEINIFELTASRYLHYSAGSGTPTVIKEVLEQACAFELIAHQNILSLSDFGVEKMGCLELCIVEECNAMTTVIGSDVSANAAFQSLEELHLRRLQEFNIICHGRVAPGSLSQLSTLTFYDCPKIRRIFSLDIIRQLSKLKYLRVEECPQVMEIIEEAGSPSVRSNPSPDILELDSLGGLEVLELVNLEGLLRVYHDESFEWPVLKKFEIIGCANLSHLSLGISNAPELHSIRCSETWWRTLAFPEDEVRKRLEGYCRFIREE